MVGRKSWSPAAVGEKLRPRTELAILWSSYCVLSCDSGVSALISRILNKWQLLHPPTPTFPWLAVSKAIFTRRLAHIHAVEPPKYTQALARIGVQGSAATLFSVTHSCTHTNPCAHWFKATKKNKKTTTQCQAQGNMYSTYEALMIRTQESKAWVEFQK